MSTLPDMRPIDIVHCRVAACPERLGDGQSWSFYLLNDSQAPFEEVVLYQVGYEWGEVGNYHAKDVRIADLAPTNHALIWRDDGYGAELRIQLSLKVKLTNREARLEFDFPKLYRMKSLLVFVEGLGKKGWSIAAKATLT